MFRCSACALNWPHQREFKTCPSCGERTDSMLGQAMPMDEARRRVNRIKFEQFYAEREERRVKRGLPSPEEMGAREAQEWIELERALRDTKGG